MARLAHSRRIVVAAVVALAAVSGGCRAPGPGAEPGKPLVVVSLPPLAWAVERLAADRVELVVALPPATTPEIWSPSPAAMLAVADADLYFGVGHPAIAFEARLLQQASAVGAATLTLAEVAGARMTALADPHLWLDPTLVAATMPELARRLGALDPQGSDLFAGNAQALAVEIAALDEGVGAALVDRRRDLVVVQHAAWSRLLRRHGVSERAIEMEGKEPEPGRMVELIEIARQAGVPTVFSQRGSSDRSARLIAAELGAEVVALDPLAHEWAVNLEQAARMFSAALD